MIIVINLFFSMLQLVLLILASAIFYYHSAVLVDTIYETQDHYHKRKSTLALVISVTFFALSFFAVYLLGEYVLQPIRETLLG
jgi:hypothetical protein